MWVAAGAILWLTVINVDDFSVPQSAKDVPAAPGVRGSDRAVGGSNLYLDRTTLYTLRVLARVTADDRYEKAVRDYLSDYLACCQSPETGMLAWGEHLYYDLTGEQSYLDDARKLADTAIERLWAGGLFRRLPGDRYYENKLGPGDLASALLRLDPVPDDPKAWDWCF